MDSNDSITPTHIFLLSVWQEADSGKETLRFRLEDPHTGESYSFIDLEQLGIFLRTRILGQST